LQISEDERDDAVDKFLKKTDYNKTTEDKTTSKSKILVAYRETE
jgi:hypothetical protein